MKASLIAAAAAALILASPAAFAAGGAGSSNGAGGGNGGATPPNVSTNAAVGSPNAQPPSYAVSGTTPTGSATSSNHWKGQGPQTKTMNGQNVTGSTATLNGPKTASQ